MLYVTDLTLLGRKLNIIEEEERCTLKDIYVAMMVRVVNIVLSSLPMVATTWFILPHDEDVANSTVAIIDHSSLRRSIDNLLRLAMTSFYNHYAK